jgi:hypothetical protein
MSSVSCSVGDQDPQDPHVFVPSGSIKSEDIVPAGKL